MTTTLRVPIKAAFLTPHDTFYYVYGAGRAQQIAESTDLLSGIIFPECLDQKLDALVDTEVIFSGWGMPQLRPDQLDRMPGLRAVFYAAGSCRGFARPLLERKIIVSSAWRVNAVPVAEFALAQILLSCKGYWRNVHEYNRSPELYDRAFRGPGNSGETIAILGAGSIGRTLIDLLANFRHRVVVYDPFLPPSEARHLGVELVTLRDAFEQGYVVSNHMADSIQTVGIINGPLLRLLRPGATFINTGRGRTVRETDLIEVLSERPDITALLDVTDPEPMHRSSPLRLLPNAHVSAHIAGAINQEVAMLADCAIEEFERYSRGEPLHHAITMKMLETMA